MAEYKEIADLKAKYENDLDAATHTSAQEKSEIRQTPG